jgi:hypothetical protein
VALVAYFLVFFAWLLPNHALSHEVRELSRRVVWSEPEVDSPLIGHNPDQCQLCRAHAQMDLWPGSLAAVIIPIVATSLVIHQDRPTNAGIPLPLSPRAPPATA